jgi:hypothetical protein
VKHNVTGGWVRANTKTGTGIAEITVSTAAAHPRTRYRAIRVPRLSADRQPARHRPRPVHRRIRGQRAATPGHAGPDGGLDVRVTLPTTANEQARRQPQTLAPQIWQPDHRIPPAAAQGNATAG